MYSFEIKTEGPGLVVQQQARMSLSMLPIDLIRPIVGYLDGNEVMSLIRTGDTRLSQTVRHVTRDWTFHRKGFAPFPFYVYNTNLLASLHVSMVKGSVRYPLNFLNRSIAPLRVQNHLITLKLELLGSFSILEDDILLKHAPNLKTLVCVDLSPRKYGGMFHHLPSSLKTLELSTKGVAFQEVLPIDAFSRILPRSIEKIIIPFLSLSEPELNDRTTGISWPKNLKHLSMSKLPMPSLLDFMPENIEVLDGLSSISTQTEILMSNMPRTMKIMSVICFGFVSLIVKLDAPMPPELVTWNLGRLQCDTPEALSFFSPKLEKLGNLEELRVTFPELDVAIYMPHCKRMDLNLGNFAAAKVNGLPRHLEHLNLVPLDFGPHSILPPTITQEIFSTAPTTLQSLILRVSSPGPISALPRSITRLELFSSSAGSIAALAPIFEQWQGIPPGLTHLTLDPQLLSSVEHLSVLPESLTMLKLWMSEMIAPDVNITEQDTGSSENASSSPLLIPQIREIRRRDYQRLRFDPRLPQFLPSQLITLEINCYSIPCSYGAWICNLGHLKCLETLEVSCDNTSPSPFYTSSEVFLSRLPPNLTQIKIPINIYRDFPVTTLNHLPASLTSLKLSFPFHAGQGADEIKPHDNMLTNEHLAHLPPSLTVLTMHGQLRSFADALSPKLFDVLPQHLTSHPFGYSSMLGEDWNQAWLRYCDPVKWLGFPPKS